MNVVNRITVIVLTLILIVIVAVVAILPKQALEFVGSFFDWAAQQAQHYQENDPWVFAAARVIIGGAIGVLCLLLLWLELRRPRKKTIRAQKLAGGEAHIAVDSIAQRLAYNIDQLPDVVKVSPRITGKARGVDVDLHLETSPDIDVPMKTEEVMQVTKEVIAERMGLKVGKVLIRIKHAPFPKE